MRPAGNDASAGLTAKVFGCSALRCRLALPLPLPLPLSLPMNIVETLTELRYPGTEWDGEGEKVL
jgi:hypothetical protein